VEEGTVKQYDWPVPPGANPSAQTSAWDDCLARHGPETRWIAFIDLDEFLFSPAGAPVPEALREFEHLSGLGVPWALFGPSGHKTPPPGLVIENYTERSTKPRRSRWFKSVVDPRRVRRSRGPHAFDYDDDVGLYPVPAFAPFDRLRINHYWTKSEEEFRRKIAGPRAHPNTTVPLERALTITAQGYGMTDDAILRYLPAVRQALAAREQSSNAPAEADFAP
jgi:Glycosyltransferase family 92